MKNPRSGVSILSAVTLLAIAFVGFAIVSASLSTKAKMNKDPRDRWKRTVKLRDVAVALGDEKICLAALSLPNNPRLTLAANQSFALTIPAIVARSGGEPVQSLIAPGDRIGGVVIGPIQLVGSYALATNDPSGSMRVPAQLQISDAVLKLDLFVNGASREIVSCQATGMASTLTDAEKRALCLQLGGAYVPVTGSLANGDPTGPVRRFCRFGSRRFGGFFEQGDSTVNRGCETTNTAVGRCECDRQYSPVTNSLYFRESLRWGVHDDVSMCWR